jgi:hypothetical protein
MRAVHDTGNVLPVGARESDSYSPSLWHPTRQQRHDACQHARPAPEADASCCGPSARRFREEDNDDGSGDHAISRAPEEEKDVHLQGVSRLRLHAVTIDSPHGEEKTLLHA